MTDLNATRFELAAFITELRDAYPQWNQRTLISQMRRAIPDYNHGIWSVAMPLNRGPSELPSAIQERIALLRNDGVSAGGVDLAHILASLDIYFSVDLIDDVFASWAGDLGSHALHCYQNDLDTMVGADNSYASMADLIGDIDGDTIARHAQRGRELEDALVYYQLAPPRPGMPTMAERYETFLRDLDLLDESGDIRVDADSRHGLLYKRVSDFVYWDEMEESLSGRDLGTLARLILHPDMRDTETLNDRIARTVAQFVAILQVGLAAERAVKA